MPKIPSFKTGMTIACITLVVLYVAGLALIFYPVNSIAQAARSSYDGDHVEALIALVEDEDAPMEKRNSAIWALGQIGDRRALPTLRALDTDEYQEPPYDSSSYIVQRNLDEAIHQVEKDAPAQWVYRFL